MGLSVNKISVQYGGRPVVQNASFELGEGRMVALLGPNGAGKTTLIKALNGTVEVSEGEVRIGGRIVGDLSRREIASEVAVVAQENETKFPVTVLEFVLSGRFASGSMFGWESERDVAEAREALEKCDLEGFATRYMNELSGGERQRVVLARALGTGARLLLLDEPTANLDLEHQAMMFRVVREKCDLGSSAVVITHDVNLAAEFADSILLLKDGSVFATGVPGEVLNEGNIKEVFGVAALLDRNPVSGNVRFTAIYK